MTHESERSAQAPITDLIRNSSEFSEAHATEVARSIAQDMTGMLADMGMPGDLVSVFDKRVAKPAVVQYDDWMGGDASHYEMLLPWKVDQEDEDFSVLALGHASIEHWANVLEQAAQSSDQNLGGRNDHIDLAFGWMVGHELGHGLQFAYSFNNRTPSDNPRTLWVYPSTSDYLVDHPEEQSVPNPSDAGIVESERQAEGIGRLYLARLLAEKGVDEGQIDQISEAISRTFSEHGKKRAALLDQTSETVSLYDLGVQLGEGPKSITIFGYASPLGKAELLDRFSPRGTASEDLPTTGSFVEHDPEDDNLLAVLEGEPDNNWLREAQMSSWFVDPVGTAVIREADGFPPMDEDDYARWLAEQSPEKLHFLSLAREQQARTVKLGEQVRKELLASVPELYEARLPKELENRLDGVNYAIGFNQTMASTAAEATTYLKETHGIDFTNYSLAHRFLMYDQSMHDDTGTLGQDSSSGIARAIESGYFGNPEIGRFIAVFPEADAETREAMGGRLANAVSLDETVLPEDAIVRYEDERGQHTSLNSKYVAGFIDETGSFWRNNNFLLSYQAALSLLHN